VLTPSTASLSWRAEGVPRYDLIGHSHGLGFVGCLSFSPCLIGHLGPLN
jgi:hypothetical protein